MFHVVVIAWLMKLLLLLLSGRGVLVITQPLVSEVQVHFVLIKEFLALNNVLSPRDLRVKPLEVRVVVLVSSWTYRRERMITLVVVTIVYYSLLLV